MMHQIQFEEVIAILDQSGGEAKVMAGGQSLIPMLKLRFASPARVVDINGIPELEYHRIDPDGTLRIGALLPTRGSRIQHDSWQFPHAGSSVVPRRGSNRANTWNFCWFAVPR